MNSEVLTEHVEYQRDLPGRHQVRVGGLAREHGGVVPAPDGRPQQPVLDDVTRVVLVLLVHQHAVHQPPHRRLRPTCTRNIT